MSGNQDERINPREIARSLVLTRPMGHDGLMPEEASQPKSLTELLYEGAF